MSDFQLLKGKRGIIFGALNEESIAWKIAEKAKAAGAEFVLSNAPFALRVGNIKDLAPKLGAELIAADVTKIEDLENLFDKATEVLGGKIDFILHAIGMSPNVRKKREYGDLNYDWMMQTLDISGVSLHKVLQVAEKKDALNEWASVVALSYIAAQRTFAGYSDMAEAKSVLESIARSYGYRLGRSKKVRINTVSQSPTITSAGKGIGSFNTFFEYAERVSPLGNASAEACADYVVALFSDLTRMVTMQNLFHDGGFSTTGISDAVIDLMAPKEDQ